VQHEGTRIGTLKRNLENSYQRDLTHPDTLGGTFGHTHELRWGNQQPAYGDPHTSRLEDWIHVFYPFEWSRLSVDWLSVCDWLSNTGPDYLVPIKPETHFGFWKQKTTIGSFWKQKTTIGSYTSKKVLLSRGNPCFFYRTTDIFIQHINYRTHVHQDTCINVPMEDA